MTFTVLISPGHTCTKNVYCQQVDMRENKGKIVIILLLSLCISKLLELKKGEACGNQKQVVRYMYYEIFDNLNICMS